MNRIALRGFASFAGKKLRFEIKQKACLLGLDNHHKLKDDIGFLKFGASLEHNKIQLLKLVDLFANIGFEQAIEDISYYFFIRLIAITHISVNGLDDNNFDTEISLNALEQQFYLSYNDDKNAFKNMLPRFPLEPGNEALLLSPVCLFSESGIAKRLVELFNKERSFSLEEIGWLHQYFHCERKSEIINIYKGTIKKEDIPAATQVFTPSWVVKYMVDNSLGGYWLDNFNNSNINKKCKYLLKLENDLTKARKQIIPEEITFIDPCMGTGHILLYAFDVFMAIYKECGYAESDAAILILKNNLFGLDIDAKAGGLASFCLKLKAANYNRKIFSMDVRPNVYSLSEPNKVLNFDLLKEYLTKEDRLLTDYLLNAFIHAKEIGSLISTKSKDYAGYIKRLNSIYKDFDYNENAKYYKLLIDELKALALQASILVQKYTIVVTNPPYMNKIEGELKKFINNKYKQYSKDLFAVFLYRCFNLCKDDGYLSFMTPYVWMFIRTYEPLRRYIIENKTILSLIQMEYSAFIEATVPLCTFALKNNKQNQEGIYVQLTSFKGGMDVQAKKVREAVENINCGYTYLVEADSFKRVTGAPIAFWASDYLRSLFADNKTIEDIASPRQGLATGDNQKYTRLWHEVNLYDIGFNMRDYNDFLKSGKKYIPYNKGGKYRKWYGNQKHLLRFDNKAFKELENRGNRLPSKHFYCKECITWSKVTSGGFSMRYIPKGFAFDVAGCSIFSDEQLMQLLGLTNSKVMQPLLNVLSQTLNYEVGNIKSIPVKGNSNDVEKIKFLVKEAVSIVKKDWDEFETSWDFKKNPLV